MKGILSGTGVALVTPFKADGSIDFDSLANVVDSVIKGGVDYLVALGTTAETPTLSFAERKQVLETIVEQNNKRVPVVVGIGCNNPIEVKEQFHLFDFSQIEAILSVTPYYNRPQQRGLIGHYESIASQSPRPVILYNVPSRTGVNIEAETTLYMAKHLPNVIGIKEASGNMGQIMHILHQCPENFSVISGDDALTLALMACGVQGVISVVANAFPAAIVDMVKAAGKGDFEKARQIHYRLLDITNACFMDGNPSGIKAFLFKQGLIDNHLRLPLSPVKNSTLELIEKLLKQW